MEIYRKISLDHNEVGIQMFGDGLKTNINKVYVIKQSFHRRIDKVPKNIIFCVPKTVDSFRGRDSEMEQLRNWLFKENKKMVAISGLSGYGKTELAKQFVRYCKDLKIIDNIIWINSESRDSIIDAFRELLKNFTYENNLPIRRIMQMVYQYFEDTSTIFVFDNVLDRQSFFEFEPTNNCLSLITSHVCDWDENIPILEISSLSINDSLSVINAVLGKHYQKEHEKLYTTLANTLSCVPLALQIAAALIRQEIMKKRSNFNLEKYVKDLEMSPDDLMDKNFPTTCGNTYKNSMCQALKISLLRIDTNDKVSLLANHILHICAYLDPENITVFDLANMPYMQTFLRKNNIIHDEFFQALSLLHNHSFIRYGDNITIHRFVQEILLYLQKQSKLQKQFYTACLNFILFGNNQIQQFAVIRHADKNIDTFMEFYLDNKNLILRNSTILETLVATGSSLTLNLIITNMRKKLRKEFINNLNLIRQAAVYNQYDILKFLLNYGCNVNQKDVNSSTALTEAVFNLNLNTIKLLIDHDADVNSEDRFGYSVLHSVIIASSLPLYQFRREETKEIFQWLLWSGADVETVSCTGSTLLHTAAFYLLLDLVEYLIVEYKLDVNAQDNNLWTPLHFVCHKSKSNDYQRERLMTAELLLKHGASLKILNDEHKTPARHARDEQLDYLADFLEEKEKYQTYNSRKKKRRKIARSCNIL